MKAKDLPIYRDTFELMKMITQHTRNFPRDLKISLGERLRNDCLDIVINVYRANASRQGRLAIVEAILETIQVVEMTLRLCCDMALISKRQHGQLEQIAIESGAPFGPQLTKIATRRLTV